MKFLVDENFHLAIYQFLKDQGYDATSVAKDYSSFEDLEILSIANKEKRVIITNDKDFGELIFRYRKSSRGVILLRLKIDFPDYRIKVVLMLIKKLGIGLNKKFVVASEDRIRIKKL